MRLLEAASDFPLTPPAPNLVLPLLKSHGKSHEWRLSIHGRISSTNGQVLHKGLSFNNKGWTLGFGF